VVLTYSGATLTSGANTIGVATVSADTTNPVGTIGSEQFAIGFDDGGAALDLTNYDYDANIGDYSFVASTTTPVLDSDTNPVATQTISAYYLANISAATEAGAYTTAITYIATGTF
jgi:hypothetical protein